MTPKQKAEELVDKYYNIDDLLYETLSFIQAKQCALIAVDEILKSNPIQPLSFMLESEALDAAHQYWQEVKQEIESYDNKL